MEKMFKQPSVMSAQQHFSNVPTANVPRSRFDRSHAYKTTFDAGLCIPIFVDEVLPGDTFDLKFNGAVRMATPLRPIMDNLYIDVHWFFVPNRLVWSLWEEFCGQRTQPDDNPNIIGHPQHLIDLSQNHGRLSDYFGLPNSLVGVSNVQVNSLPFRAYDLIWNEWYRDQNLQDSIVIDTGSTITNDNPAPRPRGKRKDYFTSCLPWPQKGDPVLIPLAETAPVHGLGVGVGTVSSVPLTQIQESGGSTVTYSSAFRSDTSSEAHWLQEDPARPGFPLLWADLAAATAVSINDLRTAFQIQILLERDARGGTRYPELILSHFGVRSPDARLQRPEYLGGHTGNIYINPVAATFAGGDIAQGDLGGVGTGNIRSGFNKSFTEHGILMGIASARADLTYQNGVERMWFRNTRYDYYWPALSNLGEQAVLTKELYYSNNPTLNNAVFGYQERYGEYRYKPSRVTGLFASDVAGSLDVWHLSQDFADYPVLNESFIVENPPIDRVIAVPDEPHFLFDGWFTLRCTRPMPIYAVPGWGSSL